jgi:hypothetical protein
MTVWGLEGGTGVRAVAKEEVTDMNLKQCQTLA